MDSEQTLKILKLVQEGVLTPEQGQRLIQELDGAPRSEAGDWFQVVEGVGKTVAQGVESLWGLGQQTVRDALGSGPTSVIVKVIEVDTDLERYQLTLPYQVFTALKPLLIQKPSLITLPWSAIDFAALFAALESRSTGLVFEFIDRPRGERVEVWVS